MGGKAIAASIAENRTITSLDASKNAMGTAGAKAFGDMLLINKTIQTLDVSDNSFGKMQVGDQVKIKSSGETKIMSQNNWRDSKISVEGESQEFEDALKPAEFEWESQVPAFCAGVAASPSLISVSTIFRYALAVSISHSSPHSYHVRSSMLMAMPSAKPAERPLWMP